LVRSFIEDRYLAGTANAEAQYKNAAGDEDTLTGALGALISTSGPVHFSVYPGIEFVVEINFRKIRGRGAGAPEKRLGADGIFQLEVTAHGQPVFRKGLPFQSKKNWKGRNRQLADQARVMKERVRDGIAFDYTPGAYAACEIDHVIEAQGNRKTVTQAGYMQPLGQILAHRFLDCEVGRVGLYYDDQSEEFVQGLMEGDLNIITTGVGIIEPQTDAPRGER
jgi:hypothetical protein